VLFEPYDASLDLHVESAGGRGSQSRIGACCKTQFTKEAYSRGQSGTEMKNKLPLVKATMTTILIRSGKIDIAESGNVQRRIRHFRWLPCKFVIGVLHAGHRRILRR